MPRRYARCNVAAMKLSDYLVENALTLDAFAAQINRSAATVSRIARGLNRPDWETMEAIVRATSGRVTPNDFADLPSDTEAA